MYNISPQTLFTGKKVIFIQECQSTNSLLIEKLASPLSEGTLLITSCQTAGKGQRGNSWEAAPDKNLTLSLLLKPSFLPVINQFYLNMAVCLAITDTVTHFTTKKVTIKWPNDIYVETRKICGILINNFVKGHVIENSVIGIGLNVNQEKFVEPKAVSLKILEEREFSLNKLLENLLENLEKRYLSLINKQFQQIEDAYFKKMFRLGEKHSFKSGSVFEGIIRGVDSSGKLILETELGVRYFGLKEIEYII